MGEVVSFINMKGGVGKTTLSVNIGYALAVQHEKRVLLIDCDPQFNASTYLMTEAEYLDHINSEDKHSILDLFMPRRTSRLSTVMGKAKPTKRSNPTLDSCTVRMHKNTNGSLDLMPSTLALMEIETSQRGTENRLRNFLEKMCNAYDYILIDCPPTISIFTLAAVLASQKYLVPLKPDPLSTIGLPLLERWLEEFADSAGREVQSLGIVFCMVRGRLPNQMKKVMEELRAKRGDEIFKSFLTQSTKVAESVEKHKPVFLHSPGSKPANEVLNISEEFLERAEGK